VNETGENLGELTLLASGVSNWEGSPSGRDYNVRKGLNEKVNNILLAPGEEYDFNKNLGPVTNSAGWQNSLAIFRGSELIPVPGGGLCQVSTTVYRAAINAGLEITERSNHSLYVHYYKAYGDGLDAAIYPGSKNLRFTNDTDNYMLLQAYDDGYDGFVNIYGTPDGRDVELVGPFYPNDIPEEWQDRISLAYNQIGWWQIITDADGNVLEEKQLTGSYRSIPY
jgi:vancomycin resistance protein YoaR